MLGMQFRDFECWECKTNNFLGNELYVEMCISYNDFCVDNYGI